MAARSIASLSLGFGLVSIPVKLYSATESAASVRMNMLAKDGSRLKPPMGFEFYKNMTAADLDAIVAYLRTVPAKE